ncbi:glutathione S-transferase [Neorhizobium huautlense]|uniref:Glutathione S-transferase n=1 Tax=Neorhizobium huautlense TaxID=67774 RepID=A0ABT9PZY5_9HYPH|nr:glutathione S-transferase [Neorhizobium huautlense]MDP9840040.1 glutathione S-transferase [Neorhizobium huautlense]
MFILHHLSNSRSQRVLWMLEELGFPYEIRFYKRDPKSMLAPPELRTIHPLGKAPILEDQVSGKPLILVETGAICEYLVSKADGRLGPPDQSAGLLRYRQFLHYAEGSVMPMLLAKLAVSRVPLLGNKGAKRIQPMIDHHLDYIERELTDRAWFAGDIITAADIMMSFPLEVAKGRAGLDASRPATMAWLDKIHSRPAYRLALTKGGEYAYA